jgi:RND family efflux transporter MFP subunit
MTDEQVASKKHLDLRKLWNSVRSWVIAFVGFIGVAVLLMMFAGVFAKKVPDTAVPSVRLPGDRTQVVDVGMISRPRFESAVGSIEPIHKSSVAAKILAKVVEVNATAGQSVRSGEVLVRLNDDDLQSRLKQTEAVLQAAIANAEQARSNLRRAERLKQENAISQAEYEAAATAVRTAEASQEQASRAVEEAKVFLDYATITAPFDGVIVDKQVQAGDMVTPGQTLLNLYDPDQMQLVANVRESFAMKLRVGQQVLARLESLDYECMATVREVVPQAEAGSRSFQVKASGPCPAGIYSGMFGRILLPLEDEQLTVIPSTAVKRVGQLTLVDVVEDGKLLRRSVQLGRTINEHVEVLSGLIPGERIAVPASSQQAKAEAGASP